MAESSGSPAQGPTNTESTGGSQRRSIGELVGSLSEQFARLLRAEINSYKSELTRKLAKSGMGIGLIAAAGVFALFGVGYLFFAIFQGLDSALPGWAASLITAAIILIIAGALALVGKNAIQKNTPPSPAQAIKAIKEDVNHIKDGIK